MTRWVPSAIGVEGGIVARKKPPHELSKSLRPDDSEALWRGFEEAARRVRDRDTRDIIRTLASILVDHEARLAALEDEPRESG